jgi:arsenate reductase (glutaredoxin)
MKIYHNPKCSKSRQALELIQSAEADLNVIEYLKTPPSVSELESLLDMLNCKPEEIVRKKEALFTELGLRENPPQSAQAWLEVLAQNPQLIERPIVTDGTRAVIGRPLENVKALLS